MDSSEPAWCALQHMKFKEAVEQWRKTKKGKIQIVREDAAAKRCSCPYHQKLYLSDTSKRIMFESSDDKCIYATKNSSSSSWKRMYDTYYDAFYWHNIITGERQWETIRGQCPV